ncbi:hypothetical protein [Flavobacterium poyangense]|uniref:hypothetical protein n=1 Tax=Flavobacterium poyangense TaxID=2204302 RepID=UPI00141E893B|nr:hypothetical protein [Flavobacterium sp. JXAS1]
MKIKYFKFTKSILLFSILLIVNPIRSQGTASYLRLNVKAPNVTDFIRYGNIQASSFTGAIDLKIPLLSVQNNNQTPIDIGLIYNSSGFMPSKRSGLVGLNWALNVGGVISRQIKGVPDDYVGWPNEQSPSVLGVFNKNGFIIGLRKNPLFTTNDVFNFSSTTGFQHRALEWMLGTYGSNVAYEGSPDIFEFNFNGITGKFHIGNDGKAKVVTNQSNNLIVDITGISQQNGTSCAPTPSEIKITDNQGNQYFFGGTLNNLEYNLSLGGRHTRFMGIQTQPIITSWFLRKIIYTNNSEINFTNRIDTLIPDDLGDGPTSNIVANRDFLSLNQYIAEERTFQEYSKPFFGRDIKDYSNSTTSGIRTMYELQKKVILDKIEGDNFIVNFNYSPQLHKFNRKLPTSSVFEYEDIKLDSINLTDKANTVIKKINFSYTYLGGTYNRMFLETMTEYGKTPYKFEYNAATNLPDPSSRGLDYWGFWNGLDTQNTLIPDIDYTPSGDFSYTSNTREPSFDKSKQGLLIKVIYPTGGHTQFEYEPHYYNQFLDKPSSNNFLPLLTQKNGTAGGARINKIIDFDGQSNTNIREFKYLKNYSPTNPSNTISSGTLMNWPRYAIHFESNNAGEKTSCIIIKSNSVTTSNLDNLITYSEVAETTNGNGYSVSKFKDYSTTPDLDINNKLIYNGYSAFGSESNLTPLGLYKNHPGLFLDDRSIERGKLISKKIYDNSNNLKNEEIFTYNNSVSRFDRYSISIHNTGVWSQSNRLYYYNDYLTQKTSITYNNSNPITTTEKYEYGTESLSDNLISKSIVKSQTGTLTSKYYYPHDPLMVSEPLNVQLIAKNIIGTPLKTESFNEQEKLSETTTKYASYPSSIAGQSLLLPQFVYTKKGNVLFSQLERKTTYNNYDSQGNITQYTIENENPVSVIWGYNKTLPIAKFENATNTQIATVLGVSDLNALNETNLPAIDALRNNIAFSNCMISTYTHIPLVGVRTITDPKGDKMTYTYDIFGKLEFVKDKNDDILSENQYKYKQ